MALKKYYKQQLLKLGEQGYKMALCDDEKDALECKEVLKKNGRCSQAGYVLNSKGKQFYFVLSKESDRRGRPAKASE